MRLGRALSLAVTAFSALGCGAEAAPRPRSSMNHQSSAQCEAASQGSADAALAHLDTAVARQTSAHAALAYLDRALRPWPTPDGSATLALTSPATGRVTAYDNALVALVMLRVGRTADTRKILRALARLQAPDGSLPFSFIWPKPDLESTYVRAGALAWVGYAAVDYLDSSREPDARETIVAMTHRIAAYLLARQVARPGDPRDGLITGGAGSFRYETSPRGVREVFVPGEVEWAATEHNIDAFFFLRALSRLSAQPVYGEAADRIARALLARGFDGDHGQLMSGFHERGTDHTLALDCASWGALFLLAAGEGARAETAAAVADATYGSVAPMTGAAGHKPYRHKPLIENIALAKHYAGLLEHGSWDQLAAVWPEGSAGVALAAWRMGAHRRARDILDALEPLRQRDGSLPTLTAAIPFEFDVGPSVGGTAWVELVRYELDHPEAARLWAAH